MLPHEPAPGIALVFGSGAGRFKDCNIQFFIFMTARHIFIAAADCNNAAKTLAADYGFNGVGSPYPCLCP